MTRRDTLRAIGAGFGMLGFADLMTGASLSPVSPLAPKAPHFPAKAKRVIFLFLNGGPSQVDTFDPKPMLAKYSHQPMPTGNLKTERKTGNLLPSPFTFRKYGKAGIEVSEIFPNLGQRIDDFCVIRSMHTDRPNHEPSLFLMNCGEKLPGPAFYGLLADLRAGYREPEFARIRGAMSRPAGSGTATLELDISARGLPGHVYPEQ